MGRPTVHIGLVLQQLGQINFVSQYCLGYQFIHGLWRGVGVRSEAVWRIENQDVTLKHGIKNIWCKKQYNAFIKFWKVRRIFYFSITCPLCFKVKKTHPFQPACFNFLKGSYKAGLKKYQNNINYQYADNYGRGRIYHKILSWRQVI